MLPLRFTMTIRKKKKKKKRVKHAMQRQPEVDRLRAAGGSDSLSFRVHQILIRPRESVGRVQQVALLERVRVLPFFGNTIYSVATSWLKTAQHQSEQARPFSTRASLTLRVGVGR